MANAFAGYLMKSGNDIFPHNYIQLNSWSTKPDQREEIKAYRDDNTRALTRVTASGHKTAIQFKTRPKLRLDEKIELLKWFTDHETNSEERKLSITFWDDDASTYKTGDFYRANQEFPIYKILDDDIIYGEVQFDLVEY